MTKKFLYFQPRYVREFVCDGTNCPHNCCERNWSIEVDAETYERYTRIQPASKAHEITACFIYDADAGKYFLKDRPCPFLTERKLCSLQLKYGEDFLSLTCRNYPRFMRKFGEVFERSLSLTCPVAAEMILFRDEPIAFEFREEVSTKIGVLPSSVPPKIAAHVIEMQVVMISIMQERTLTIDQRLIVLGFFLDRLDEIISANEDVAALTKLITAYESKDFLTEQVPRMLAIFRFDAKKFVGKLLVLLEKIFHNGVQSNGGKFMDALIETLKILPDAQGKVSVTKLTANYERLTAERRKFPARRSTFLENFLVNELFLNCYPWRFQASVAKNFGIFVASYKIFELLTFAAAQKNLDGKDDLLRLVDWFTNQMDHSGDFSKEISECVPDDIFSLAETLLQP